jgi:CBS domain-containing protein
MPHVRCVTPISATSSSSKTVGSAASSPTVISWSGVWRKGRDLAATKVGDICSQELTSVSLTDEVEQAVLLMRDKAVRRLLVVEGGKRMSVVSIGDLAIERALHSALGKISEAPPNR